MTARADSDAERSLTVEGEVALREVMSRRTEDLSNVVTVFSGPLGRLRETAKIASQVIAYKGDILDNPSLNKLTRGEEITATLEDIDMSAGDLLLVSHESSLCNLMMWLTGEDILMPNSSLSAIETHAWSRGAGKLLWQESPKSREIKLSSNFADMF